MEPLIAVVADNLADLGGGHAVRPGHHLGTACAQGQPTLYVSDTSWSPTFRVRRSQTWCE